MSVFIYISPIYPVSVLFIYCNLLNSSCVYFCVIFVLSICFTLYTVILLFSFVLLVSTLICFTGSSYLYGFSELYLPQFSLSNVAKRFPVSSSYISIVPFSPSNFSGSEKYIPAKLVMSFMLSVLESIFINSSDTFSPFPCVSFITILSAFPCLPVCPYHLTIYVSSFSSSDIPLYIFKGFCFDTIYLFDGSYEYFPTYTSNIATSPSGFLYVIVNVFSAIFDLYGFSNSSFVLLYPS